MHIHRPGTDQTLEITILINGVPATEYEIPNASSTASLLGYLNTYIAVKPSDRLTVKWTFSGSILHGQFDFVADGTLVRENRIEGDSQAGAVKYVKKTLKFETGLDCPKPEGWYSAEPNKDLFEGTLVVADLDVESLGEVPGGRRPGVGSLVFVASVNQQTLEQYHDQEKTIEMGNWKKRVGDQVIEAEIAPEYALQLRLSNDDKIKSKRSIQHRNRWIQNRFGLKAWGKMCFYYRSAAAIERAGGVKRDDKKVLEVEAWDGDKEFVEVEPVKRAAPKRKSGAVSDDEDANESLFVSMQDTPERVIKEENLSDRAPSPLPQKTKKKAKLGGTLFGSAEKVHHKVDDAITTTEADQMDYEGNNENVMDEGNNENGMDEGNNENGMDESNNEDGMDESNNENVVDESNNEDVMDEGFGSQDDVEPTSSELAAAPEPMSTPEPDPVSSESAKKLDYFDQEGEESETSTPAPIDDSALPPPDWRLSTSPPAHSQQLSDRSPSSLAEAEANAAMDPAAIFRREREESLMQTSSRVATAPASTNKTIPITALESELPPPEANMAADKSDIPMATPRDRFTMPTETEVKNAILPEGVSQTVINNLLKANKPYENCDTAEAFFATRVALFAYRRGDNGLYYPKNAPVPPKPAARGAPPPKKSNGGSGRRNTEPKAVGFNPAPPRRESKQGTEQHTSPDPSIDEQTNPQTPPPAAAPAKRKNPATTVTTPSSSSTNKRMRSESSTPGASAIIKTKRQYAENLRRTLADKKMKIARANDRSKKQDKEIAELEKLNREADQQLEDLERAEEESDAEYDFADEPTSDDDGA